MKSKREIRKENEKRNSRRKTAACLGVAFLVTALAGCGSSTPNAEGNSGWEPVSAPQAEEEQNTGSLNEESKNSKIHDSETYNDEAQNGESRGDKSQKQQSQDGSEQTDDGQSDIKTAENSNEPDAEVADSNSQNAQKLIGSVKSIGENSIVISRAFEETSNILVAPGDGSPDEVFVTVICSDDTEYEVRNVKNGGVNGDSDVDKKSGSFSDIAESAHVDIIGNYKEADFYAAKIIIYHFI